MTVEGILLTKDHVQTQHSPKSE